MMAEASYRAFKERDPALRPWIYSRSGYAGLQRYARTCLDGIYVRAGHRPDIVGLER